MSRLALVTGAAGGIGEALARRLHREGYDLALVDRQPAPLAALARELGASAHVMDVSDAGAWDALAAALGPIDLLVNNAGINVHGAFVDQTRDDIDRIVGVNLLGVLHGSRAFVPALAARRGHLVNVSSLAGVVAIPTQSTYCATKFAVRGFTAALRLELAPRGVGVTAVLPGTVATTLLATARTHNARTSRRMAELMQRHGIAPARVAERIVRAIDRNEAEVIIGWDAHLATGARALAPRALAGLLGAAFAWADGRAEAKR